MAKASLILVVSLLLIISLAESKRLSVGLKASNSDVVCNSVYGAEAGDTCGSVVDKFQLSFDFFLFINPNINCDSFFVGQWLCTDGTA
ncbi:hypothetical protein ACLB2K_054468 [Fragaria x ananassa]